MPKNPINAYRGKEFKNWIDFIGEEDQCQMSAKKLTNFKHRLT